MESITSLSPVQMVVTAVTVVGSVCVIQYCWTVNKIKKRIKRRQTQAEEAKLMWKQNIEKHGIKSQRQREKILELKFLELRKKLQSGDLKAADVLSVYQAKALEQNERLNFMVEPIMEATVYAKDCDSKSANKQRPLHGIPVSIKENYYIKDYESTGGMSCFLNKPAKEDGVMIKVLKHQGAVPFVRTNIPQSMMTYECSNPIYGTTLNPHNLKRGPGGSSGGEGAILGSEASLLGWGTDIGGSVRIPSHFCGVYCLKPTTGRLCAKSCEELIEGQRLVVPTIGPLGRDVDTLVEAMRAVLCPYLFQLDPEVPPIPFRNEIYEAKDKLRIGYYDFDGNLRCIPGVQRGVKEAKEALEKMGHKLVPFEVPGARRMFGELFMKACFGDGGSNFISQMSNDLVDSSIQMIVMTYKLPRLVQKMISYLVSFFAGDKLVGTSMRSMQGVNSVAEWWKLSAEIDQYKMEFTSKWKAQKLDAMICPTMPYVATPTGAVKYLLGGVSYTTLYNLLNFPAGCVPVTKVNAKDQAAMKDYPTGTATEKFVKKFFSSDTGGLPVAVQCVALPFQDEMALRVMKELETGLKEA